MSREVYIERNFRAASREMIDKANAIIAEYQAADFMLTLRQLYYQFVARDLFQNTLKNYRLLSRTMAWARDAGESDWDAIEDRLREVNNHAAWTDPSDFLANVVPQYAEDWWRDQHYRPEVWIEKDALLGVIAPVCSRWRVPYFAEKLSLGQLPLVLHLADHDPSGIEMTVDLTGRLERYARQPIEVKRVALTMVQVRRHRPPPNFAKEKDVNLAKYCRLFGTSECWELDALSPQFISDLIEHELKELIDDQKWERAKRREAKNRRRLGRLEVDR
jgi:hypothetical protein